MSSGSESVLGRVAALFGGAGLPAPDPLPRWLAPLPRAVENLGLSLAWLVVGVNLVGTAFGFWYYRFQFAAEPLAIWPLVPDSPVATFFIAASLALWKLGRSSEVVNALAFFGCWKLGLWTPFVLVAFADGFLATTSLPMYAFLLGSHLMMVVQAFVIHRYSDFPVGAVAVAVAWYGLNDLVDYFVPILGTPHHTLLPGQRIVDGTITHLSPTHELAAGFAVVLTLTATFLTLATRVKKLEA
ncbi:DUF1405 domain-containing protein [Haloplanus rubicundus]|uniref:DUF1405 domain-containing protein n=1 Tax=Haloplanus rubicundus TaxID=1547898 RepID=A0A345EGV5_9EURY|nr:DUF1405 domain-containing protein [Haloplanus rubicundus]AXG04955.1 DUF1405 domain-containing protein [Haloplanus rubicundus]AXG11427.1 DUF1405 domain-containing protein [Haloplanus rubicundus]